MSAKGSAKARRIRPPVSGSSGRHRKKKKKVPVPFEQTIDDIPSVPEFPPEPEYDGALFRLEKAAILKKIFDTIGILLDDVRLQFSHLGIEMFALDAGNIACVNMELGASKFDEYQCSKDISIGLNVQSVVKLFSCIKPTDSIKWVMEGTKPDKVKIFIARPGMDQSFELRLIEIEQEKMGIPDMAYDSVVTLPSKEMQIQAKFCTTLGGSNIEFRVTRSPKKFTMTMKDSDSTLIENSMVEYTQIEENPQQVSIECSQPVSDIYATSYIEKFAKAACISEWVAIHMKAECPILFKFAAGDLGQIDFYLAPKIIED